MKADSSLKVILLTIAVSIISTIVTILLYVELHKSYWTPTPNHQLSMQLQQLSFDEQQIRVLGAVKNPRSYTLKELQQLPSVAIRRKEYIADTYSGTYTFRGVALRTILQEAEIQKSDHSAFKRPLDIVIRITSATGASVCLSYGEVFLSAAEDRIIVATHAAFRVPDHHPQGGSAVCADCHSTPKQEWHDCSMCHNDDYKPKLTTPERARLICGNDIQAFRSLERPISIEVIDPELPPGEGKPAQNTLPIVYGEASFLVNQELLQSKQLLTYKEPLTGLGMGFQKFITVTGYSFPDLLRGFSIMPKHPAETVVFFLASDGYRAAYSWAELQDTFIGHPSVLAVDPGSKEFRIYPGGDFFADRGIKTLEKVALIDFGNSRAQR